MLRRDPCGREKHVPALVTPLTSTVFNNWFVPDYCRSGLDF